MRTDDPEYPWDDPNKREMLHALARLGKHVYDGSKTKAKKRRGKNHKEK